MGLLTRDQILTVSDRPTKRVSVPEWGGEVLIASLSGRQREQIEEGMKPRQGSGTQRAFFLSMCLVGEDGKPLFTEKDISALADKSCAAIVRLFDAAWKFNGFSEEEMKSLEKNSETPPSDASGSS